jgi:hypothetical protein
MGADASRLFAAILWIAVTWCGACQPNSSAINRNSGQSTAPSFPPTRSPTVSDLDQDLWQQFRRYWDGEGPAKKSSLFADFTSRLLGVSKREKRPIDEFTIFLVLGPPDYWSSYNDGKNVNYIYIFDERLNSGDVQEIIGIKFKSGFVELWGYNKASSIDFEKFAKYPANPVVDKD